MPQADLNHDGVAREGRVVSVNVSKRKGTRKTPVGSDVAVKAVAMYGLESDAHAGDWHRQVSFLAQESIERAREMGLDVKEGDFGENFTTEGIDLLALPLGTRVAVGDEMLAEISQIGKVCHTRCAIYHLAGDCIFPREGIFAVVLHEGMVKQGDVVRIVSMGDGTCAHSPADAIAEVEAARAAGTL